MASAAIPLGMAVVGGLSGKKAKPTTPTVPALSYMGTQAAQGVQQRAGDMGAAGSRLLLQGQGATRVGAQDIGAASRYFNTILSGSRSAANQALQPEIASITDIYRGASSGMDRAGVR